MAFLDETGLARFWNRVQGYVSTNIQRNNTSLTQAFGERLVSKTTTINNKPLTGNITLSYSDVGAASSSHNHDTVYVRKGNYNEDIAGTKTFTGQVVISGTHNSQEAVGLLITGNPTNYACSIQDTGYTKGTIPSENHNWTYGDAYGTARNSITDRVGLIETLVYSNNTARTMIRAYGVSSANNSTFGEISVSVNNNDDVYTSAPTPTNKQDNSTQIATTNFIRTMNGVGTTYVTGVQTEGAVINLTHTTFGNAISMPTKSYRVGFGTYASNDELVRLYSVTNANVTAGTNTPAKTLSWNAATGELKADSYTGKIGTANLGDGNTPIYLSAGTPTAFTATVGTTSRPIWLNAGSLVVCNATVGSASKPVYMNAGTMTALSATVGNANTPVYLNAGTITSTGKSFANYLPLAGGTITGVIETTTSNAGFKVESSSTKTCTLLRGTTYVGLYDGANSQWVTRVAAEKAYIHYGTVSAVSDKRNKKNITSVPESLLDAWGNIDWVQFEYKNLVNDKINIGLVAQDVEEKLNEKGINASDYPFFEHEIWEKDEEHNEAGDQYFIHYTEALAIEAAYMRRYAKQLENRIAELEAKVNAS